MVHQIFFEQNLGVKPSLFIYQHPLPVGRQERLLTILLIPSFKIGTLKFINIAFKIVHRRDAPSGMGPSEFHGVNKERPD